MVLCIILVTRFVSKKEVFIIMMGELNGGFDG